MHKVVRPGAIIDRYGNKTLVSFYCKIDFNGERLSITGVIGPTRGGNAVGGCGQIVGEFMHRNPADNDDRWSNPITPEQIDFAPGWDEDLWYAFIEVWETYHLNGLHAGCVHQRAFGWDKARVDPDKPSSSYGKHRPRQSHDTWNLRGWQYPPHGYLTKPCPICGYGYGTKWKREDVPEEIIDWLERLPDTDVKPAWS